MRIISGKYKGQTLSSFNQPHIRPTTDRVKEAIFNMFQFEFENSHILDLYSGTGNLGIEALSRNALSVTFVDSHPASIMILKKNLQKLSIKDSFEIIKSDSLEFLSGQFENPFDIILIDPPFTKKLAHSTLLALSQSKALGPSTRVAIEWSKHEFLDESYPNLTLLKTKSFGDKSLSVFLSSLS